MNPLSPCPSSSGSSTDEDEAREILIKEKEHQEKREQRRREKRRMPDDQRDQHDLELARRLQEQEMSILNHEDTDFAFAQKLQRQLEQENENNKNNNHSSSSTTTTNIYDDLEADLALARQLQLEEELQEHSRKSPSPSLVCWTKDATPDPKHELIDPTPDLHQLFMAFDQQYFKGQLASVEVKWSTRMTLCAGICEYNAGYVVIKLSEPLLKFRSREDMVNTLLHEMIHALLFIQLRIDDHDGHGPYFLREADRINKLAGTNITVYHNFHDEVSHYRRHIWKCDGPCKDRPPFYGKVCRSMNRPPQPADTWFNQHQLTCGGTFTKIAEPEGFKDKNKKKRPVAKITDFFKDWDEEVKIVDKDEFMKKKSKQQ